MRKKCEKIFEKIKADKNTPFDMLETLFSKDKKKYYNLNR